MDNLKIIQPPASLNFFSYIGDHQGCGTIRVIYPSLLLNYIRMKEYRFGAFYSSYFINDIRFYSHFSMVQFQRAATESHFNLFQHFNINIRKQTKTPLVFEIDDLLMDVPEWNYASKYYSENSENIKKMMHMVDGITVSTPMLKKIYQQFNPNIEVIPNHLPKFIWGDVNPKHNRNPREKKPRILWAGSENHFCTPKLANQGFKGGDFGNKLMNFIRKTINKYQWVMMGAAPIELKDLINNGIEFHRFKPIMEYPAYVKSLDVDIGIAPLSKGIFNDCKSNIKSQEFSVLGIPAVYSNAEPYKNMKFTCDTEEYMIDRIETLASNLDLRKEVWETDYNTIKEQLFWEDNDNLKKYINSYLKLFKKKLL